MSKEVVTFGTDIEFFPRALNGDYIPSEDLVESTKKEPLKLPNGIVVHPDGASLEFAIPPVTTKAEWVHYIREGFKSFPPHVIVDPSCAMELDSMLLAFYPNFSESGCSPDMFFDEDGVLRQRIISLSGSNYRYSGGHIHIGIPLVEDIDLFNYCLKTGSEDSEFLSDIQKIKKYSELFDEVVLSWIKNQEWYDEEAESIRNSSYGANNAFRLKEYGIEFRAPSNAWAIYDPAGMWEVLQEFKTKWLSTQSQVEKELLLVLLEN